MFSNSVFATWIDIPLAIMLAVLCGFFCRICFSTSYFDSQSGSFLSANPRAYLFYILVTVRSHFPFGIFVI